MMNSKSSASKTHIKTVKRVKNLSPRSPLKVKNLNISSSSSCSSSFSSVTSISSDAAAAAASKGCLRFFLSHHSSTLTKNRKPKSLTANKTPKSGTIVNPLRGKKLSENGINLQKNGGNLKNPEKPTSRSANRLKKNPHPCLYSWKSGNKLGLRSDLSINSVVELREKGVNFTPSKNVGGSDLVEKEVNCCDDSSPIPPIQASVSPEIQGASSSPVKATPNTCYAAGHVMSGVSDKRKCRPRGLLTIGDNDLFGSSRTKVFMSEDEDVIGGRFNKSRVSLVPCPVEASMQWLLSPCDERSEDKDDDHDNRGLRLNECKMMVSPNSIGCSSSPSSSLGFSSELWDKSNCTITSSEATTVSHSSRCRSSDFRGVLGPSFDHMVRSLSPSSLLCVPSSEVEVSPKQDKYQHNDEREATPHSELSIGSENVIQTPQSDLSSESFGLSHLSRDEISRLWFESELDSVTEVLKRVSLSPECELPMTDSPRMSFEFNPLIRPDNSIDLAKFRKAMDSQASPVIPESMFCSFPKSEVRISWREGLTSRIFDMDEVDYCRCFSDEEDDDVNGCNDQCESCSPLEAAETDSNKTLDNACDTTRLAHHKDSISQEDAESSLSKRTICPCPDSSNGV